MPNHSCVCPDALDRCDRCDVLLDFPSLHLIAVTQAPSGLLLEVESCGPVNGCPGCGVIAPGDGRVKVEMLDAPWAGRPVRIRWRKRRWICLEDVCAAVSFVEQDPRVCAPRGLLTTRAIRWAIGQLRREGATIQSLARQLGTTWNTLWTQVQPVLTQAAGDPSRFEGVQVLDVDEHIWHHRDPRRPGPKELAGAAVDDVRRPRAADPEAAVMPDPRDRQARQDAAPLEDSVPGLLRHRRREQRGTKAINGIIELGRRIARGFRNFEHYRLRMLLITGGLDALSRVRLSGRAVM